MGFHNHKKLRTLFFENSILALKRWSMSHCDVRWPTHQPLPQPLAEMGHLSIYQIILIKTQSTKIIRWPTHQPLPQRVPSKLPPVADLHLPVARAPPIVGWDQLWCSSSSSLYFKYPPTGIWGEIVLQNFDHNNLSSRQRQICHNL